MGISGRPLKNQPTEKLVIEEDPRPISTFCRHPRDRK
jgi:hypothetical protein